MRKKIYQWGVATVAFSAFLITAGPVRSARDRHPAPVVAAARSCSIHAYAGDSVRALNVRSGPGVKHRVVRAIAVGGGSGAMISAIGSSGQWLLIDSIYRDGLKTPQVKVRGWVYAPLFATRTQEGAGVKVRRDASPGSQVVARLPGDVQATLTGCRGGWVRVRHPKAAGWLDAGSQCGNPFTTCP